MKRLLSVLSILAAIFLYYACSEKNEPDEGKDDTTVIVDGAWGGTDPGSIYLGITGFNESLYTYPIKKLTSDSRSGFNTFIDGLSTKGATILCWAMDQSLDAFQESRFPSDLSTAVVVTFTDGRDQGSMGYTDRYSTRNDYLNALQDRLRGSISGVSITAYSIGLRGTDVRDTEVEDFKNDLARLASPDNPVTGEKYSFFVDNMEDVNKRFQEIAAKLSRSWNVQSVTLRIPVPGDGTLVRFTFDNVTDAEKSTLYIEGCYNKDDVKLEDLSLKGMSSPWSSVKGVKSGPYVTFTFSILRNTGITLSLNNVREWLLEPEETAWKENSEFRPDDISNEIKEEVHSAAVMLLLDCSSSLGDDFGIMRLQAKSFINTLLRGLDPTAVLSVSLNKSSLTLASGCAETLVATVLPTTANNKTVTWSSDKISVATVDSNGKVVGRDAGVATIKATTVDGGIEASCKVTVIIPEAVDLGLPSGLKWASCNLGAFNPEEYGDYYAWGETEPYYSCLNPLVWKDGKEGGYDWTSYQWCQGTKETLTKYNTNSSSGVVDNKTKLELSDDAAHVHWGGKWRMPTKEEWNELFTNSTSYWTSRNGIYGYWFYTSKGEIFIPFNGLISFTEFQGADEGGNYWPSTLSKDDSTQADRVYISSSGYGINTRVRRRGQSIRAVYDENMN